jgi:ethanolamine utilization microcompartment shell protein EutS
METKVIKKVKKLTVKETLLTLGIMVLTAGTTALLAAQYLHGMICVAFGMGILFIRGYINNGFSK